MKVCFVTSGTVNKFWQEKLVDADKPDLLVFGFNGLGLVSYKKELSGETEYFQDVAKLSKGLSCTVVSGCDTDTYGVFRHSAVIADKGKILGVSDMTREIGESEFSSGANLRVYETCAGKIGVILCEDLYFPEVVKSLSLCDADFIVCLFKSLGDYMPLTVLKASAFINGVTMAFCAKDYACISDAFGEIIVASAKDVVVSDVKIEKDYRLITTRSRGLGKEFKSGY